MKTNPQTSRRLLLGGLALALVGALAFVALRTGPLAPVKVQVTPVTKGRVTPEIFGIGLVEAQRSWMVGPTTRACSACGWTRVRRCNRVRCWQKWTRWTWTSGWRHWTPRWPVRRACSEPPMRSLAMRRRGARWRWRT